MILILLMGKWGQRNQWLCICLLGLCICLLGCTTDNIIIKCKRNSVDKALIRGCSLLRFLKGENWGKERRGEN